MILALLRLAAPYLAAGALAVALAHFTPVVGYGARLERWEAKVEAARGDLQKMQTSLTQCRTNVATLDAARKAQNDAVEALRRDSEARVAASRKAVSDARSVASSHRREADRILASRAEGDRCVAAEKLIAEVVR